MTVFSTVLRRIGKRLKLLILLSMMGLVQAAETADLIGEEPLRLGSHIEILEDPSGQLSPFDIQQPELADRWQANPQSRVNLGYSGTVVWLRFQLDAAQSIHKEWDLVIANPLLDYLDLYQIFEASGPRLIYRGGMSRPFNSRSQNHRYFIVPVSVYQPTTYLMRLESSPLTPSTITAYPSNQFWTPLQQADIVNWLFYGMILAMVFYNLFLFSTVRDLSYLYYVLFILSFGALHLSLDGYLYQYIWPLESGYDFRINYWLTHLTVIFAGLFIAQFLDLKRFAPPLFWLILMLVAVQPIAMVLAHWLSRSLYASLLTHTLYLKLLLAVFVGVYAWRRGMVAAKFFVLAWLLFAFGNVLYLAMRSGWLNLDLNPMWASKTGGFAEAMLLSFALAHRIRVLRDDRERARMRAEAQSQFLAQVSHEIRTPLNGVLGMTEVLNRTELNEEQKDCVRLIQGSGQSLMVLINDILDYSKLEAGKMVLHPDRVDPRAVTEQQVQLFLSQAEQKGLSIQLSIADEVPVKVVLDVQRLRQILSNLISNAIKYTEKGHVDVQLTLQTQPSPLLQWRIRDTGIGIPADALTKVFTLYQQVEEHRQSWAGGTGLGLAICRDLVDLMKGEISVRSESGEGTEFDVRIPFTTQFSREIAEDTPTVSAAASLLEGLNVLVAEDNLVNQRVIQGLLEKMGHTVRLFNNGQDIVDHYQQTDRQQQSYDVILMDCEMPELDGYAATQAIRAYEQAQGLMPIPIIALTAHALEDVHQRCLKSGMNEFLTKPINTRRLARVLEGL
ncbi:MAG: hybrid sensor histidine kinase/response regulator [Saccharospirillum sp.]